MISKSRAIKVTNATLMLSEYTVVSCESSVLLHTAIFNDKTYSLWMSEDELLELKNMIEEYLDQSK